MSNPDIAIIDKNDQLLSIKGLRSAGEKYAESQDVLDKVAVLLNEE